MTPPSSGSQRQFLGAELRRARDLAGLSGREMSERLGVGQSTISRIENGERLPTLPEVAKWMTAVGAKATTADRFVEMTEQASTEVETYRSALGGASHLQNRAAGMEETARTLRSFEPIIVPGLLQTAEYARRAIALSPGSRDVAEALAARLDRQQILYREGREFEFLMTEAALRWPAGPGPVVAAQLDRIVTLSTLEQIRVGVLPLRHTPKAIGWHEFTIYDVEDGPSFVHTELAHVMITINDPEDVAQYQAMWRDLSASALFDDTAAEFIQALAKDFR